ncbi:ABC transporter permease [Streptomyces sp. NPDC052052]|uniref:ABC transporter permease n=1 Tax=Streptomyces sp. NPDC052052 TaxID=3154756 RepID=UPI0034292340
MAQVLEDVDLPATGGPGDQELGSSPLALAWGRLRRDRVGMICLGIVVLFVLAGALAPVISSLYGKDPFTHYGQDIPGLLTDTGAPAGANGGISSEFWFGVEPGLGRDVLTQLLYGIRNSLTVSVICVLITTSLSIAVGVTAGYLSGLTDRIFGFVCNVLLAFPYLLLLIAMTPVIDSLLVGDTEQEPVWMQFAVLVVVFCCFGWMSHALVLRSLVRSLREREFVQAARAMGMPRHRIVLRELLPNLTGPVIVHITMAVPAYVTSMAALSFLGVGVTEPTPDWGRMISQGAHYFYSVPTFMFFPGGAILIFVLAFNLLGDAVRDALDPKSR